MRIAVTGKPVGAYLKIRAALKSPFICRKTLTRTKYQLSEVFNSKLLLFFIGFHHSTIPKRCCQEGMKRCVVNQTIIYVTQSTPQREGGTAAAVGEEKNTTIT